MPTQTSISLNMGDVLSTTLQYWHKEGKIADQIFNGLPLFKYLKDRVKTISGGEQIFIPVMYAKNTTAVSYRMYDPLQMTPVETHTVATYQWKQAAVGVFIAGLEMRANRGQEQIFDLFQARFDNAMTSLQDALNTMFWSDGTGNSSKDFLGLKALVANTPTSGTVGGINRASASWWQNKYRVGGSFEAQGINDMRLLRLSVSNNVPSGMPTVWFTSSTVYNYYENSLEPKERFLKKGGQSAADPGLGPLTFYGAPVEWDDGAVADSMYCLNANTFQLILHKDANFTPTDRVRQADQDAWSTHVLIQGELVSNCPKRNGVITSITA
jgi:hypothetical protein